MVKLPPQQLCRAEISWLLLPWICLHSLELCHVSLSPFEVSAGSNQAPSTGYDMVLVHGDEMEIFNLQLTLYESPSLPEWTHFLHHADRWSHNSSTILSFVLCPTNVPLCDHSPQTYIRLCIAFTSGWWFWTPVVNEEFTFCCLRWLRLSATSCCFLRGSPVAWSRPQAD